MKNQTLTTTDRLAVQALCNLMMDMNARDDANASQGSTYGYLHYTICSFVLNQTGVDISNPPTRYGWNLGGNATYADDIQEVINLVVEETNEKAREDHYDYLIGNPEEISN